MNCSFYWTLPILVTKLRLRYVPAVQAQKQELGDKRIKACVFQLYRGLEFRNCISILLMVGMSFTCGGWMAYRMNPFKLMGACILAVNGAEWP